MYWCALNSNTWATGTLPMQLFNLIPVTLSYYLLKSIFSQCWFGHRVVSTLWATLSWLLHMVAIPLCPALSSGMTCLFSSTPSHVHLLFPLLVSNLGNPQSPVSVCSVHPLDTSIFIYQSEATGIRASHCLTYKRGLSTPNKFQDTNNIRIHAALGTKH